MDNSHIICNQERRITEMEHTINELYKIITGNGTPANGMTSQIINIAAEQRATNTTLARIENTLSKQDQDSDVLRGVAYTASNDLRVHIAEGSGVAQVKSGNKINWQIALMTVAIVATIIIGILNLTKNARIQREVAQIESKK